LLSYKPLLYGQQNDNTQKKTNENKNKNKLQNVTKYPQTQTAFATQFN